MHLAVALSLSVPTAVTPSPNVLRVASMFGLGIDETRLIPIIPPVSVPLPAGGVVFVTGASGSGKSSLLRLIAAALAGRTDARCLRFETMPAPPDRPLVDCFEPLPLERALSVLSMAGLGDAFVMLRRPVELSDGQRYRLRLAQVIAAVDSTPTAADRLCVVLADEFGATLDRVTAHVIARNVRKWARRTPGVCFVCATTHDDLLDPLEPDVLVEKHLGEGIEVVLRDDDGATP